MTTEDWYHPSNGLKQAARSKRVEGARVRVKQPSKRRRRRGRKKKQSVNRKWVTITVFSFLET